jgi:hypothetical protein
MPAEYFLQLVAPRVFPLAAPWDSGLPVENGTTRAFVVDRGWVGPAGTYIEEWSIRSGDKVHYRHPPSYIQVRGHQAVRRFSDTVELPITLEPGLYDITFVVEKYRMGSFVAEAASPAEIAEASAAAKAPPPAPPQAPPPRRPAAAPVPAAPAAAAAVAVASGVAALAYTGEAPEAVRERVLAEELAKGSDPRVAQARAKSAEMRARKAAAAAAAAPAAAPAPAPAPAAAEYTGEAPEAVRERVLAEELAKGSDPRVAQARAKSAEMRARKAAAAAAQAAAVTPAAPPVPAPAAPAPVPAAEAAAAKAAALSRAEEVASQAPPGGGGFNPEEAAVVRALIYREAIAKGMPEDVAEAQAVAAETRARRGPWWRPDWK